MRGGAWNKLVQTLLCWLSKRFERKSSCPITINQVETRNPVRTPVRTQVRVAKAARSRAVVKLAKAGSGRGEAKARTPIAAVREARAARTPIAAVKAVRSRAGTSLANAKAKLL